MAHTRKQRSILSRKGRSADKSRTIPFRPPEKLQSKYPPNVVRNQKYNVFTFLPLVFYEQFKFFFNLYFLLVALSQLVPALKIGASRSRRLSTALLIAPSRIHRDVHCPARVRAHGHNGEGGL